MGCRLYGTKPLPELWLCDAIRHHKTSALLVPVMACCLFSTTALLATDGHLSSTRNWALVTKFNEIPVKMQIISFKIIHLKCCLPNWQPFCSGLSVQLSFDEVKLGSALYRCCYSNQNDSSLCLSSQEINMTAIWITKKTGALWGMEFEISWTWASMTLLL